MAGNYPACTGRQRWAPRNSTLTPVLVPAPSRRAGILPTISMMRPRHAKIEARASHHSTARAVGRMPTLRRCNQLALTVHASPLCLLSIHSNGLIERRVDVDALAMQVKHHRRRHIHSTGITALSLPHQIPTQARKSATRTQITPSLFHSRCPALRPAQVRFAALESPSLRQSANASS